MIGHCHPRRTILARSVLGRFGECGGVCGIGESNLFPRRSGRGLQGDFKKFATDITEVFTSWKLHKALLTPVPAPRVLQEPIFLIVLDAVSDDKNTMCDLFPRVTREKILKTVDVHVLVDTAAVFSKRWHVASLVEVNRDRSAVVDSFLEIIFSLGPNVLIQGFLLPFSSHRCSFPL